MGQTVARPASVPSTRPIVVILGGGYAGVTLARLLDESNRCFVILVDRKEFFLHSVATPRALVAKNYAQRVMIPYDRLLNNGVVIHGVVQSITPRAVMLYGRPAPITFDFLCIATGASYNFPFKIEQPITHAAAAAPQQSPPDVEAPQPLFMLDTLSAYSALYDAVLSAKRVLIVGGGCVGVETAGELIARFGKDAVAKAAAATTAVTEQPTLGTIVKNANSASAAGAPASTAAAPAAHAASELKHVTLLHSGNTLLNRQSGMRDKMRGMLLTALRAKGVQVELLQRAQLDGLREVHGDAAAGDTNLHDTTRSKDLARQLEQQGYLVAERGCSVLIPTVNAALAEGAAPTSGGEVDSQLPASTSYSADLVLLATGVRYPSSTTLFHADPEIRSCLDARGRLIVNKFFQLDGQVAPERAQASASQSATSAAASPGSDSGLHTRFSFHYPHIFALGDCAVPRDELALNLAPQAHLAHKHAQAVAQNILNLLNRSALKPYDGSGPLSLFVSLGPEWGASQLPNRQNSLSGDAMTRAVKSADMQCAATWAFLNQDESKPSFKAHASQRFVDQQQARESHIMRTTIEADVEEPIQSASAAAPSSDQSLSVPAMSPTSVSPTAAYAVSSLSGLHLHSQPLTSISKPAAPAPTLVPADQHRTDDAKPQPTIHAQLMQEQQKRVEEKLAAQKQADAEPDAEPVAAAAAAPSSPASAASPSRPAGTESLSVAVRAAPVVSPTSRPVVSSPSASSPIGPILMPGSEQERQFEAALAAGRDQIDDIDEHDDTAAEETAPAAAAAAATTPDEEELSEAAAAAVTDATTEAASTIPAGATSEPLASELQPQEQQVRQEEQQQQLQQQPHEHEQQLDVGLQSFAQSSPFADDDSEFAPAAVSDESAAAVDAPAASSPAPHPGFPSLSPLPEELESSVSPQSAQAIRPLSSTEKYDGKAFLRFAQPQDEPEEDGAYAQHASEDY